MHVDLGAKSDLELPLLGSGLCVKWQEAGNSLDVNAEFPCALNLCQVPFLCTDIESFLLQWGTWTNRRFCSAIL